MAISSTRRGAGETGARGIIRGSVSNGVTWNEDIAITQDGTAIPGSPASWKWYLMVREDYETAPILTLTTTAGTLSVTQGADSTTLSIRVPRASLTNIIGNYVVDIASVDTSDTSPDSAGESIHWAHGDVEFRNEPVFS